MGARFGLPTALFAVKCLAAAALALYVSLSIGLERPYWAFLTSFIVAQPLASAVLSKAMFRVIGTFVGAIAAVAMVPTLVNAPELLSLAFALWLALCVFVSLLDRTPRSYMFVLAGYSACIIGLPSVDTPDQIFTIAALRVQEISVGIACAGLVHGFVLPGSITDMLLGRVRGMLLDAERWSRDAIAPQPAAGLEAERRRLAQDVTELHQLSVHLPFETSRIAPRVRTVRALQDQVSLLLPLGAALQDRLASLRDYGGVPPAIAGLIADTRDWLATPGEDLTARTARAEDLRTRCTILEPRVGPATTWQEMLRLSLTARLAMLIAAHRDCRDLYDQMVTHSRQPVTMRVAELLEGRRNRELHRDYAGALRGAVGAFITLFLGCLIWIYSGWQDGGTAVMLAGVFLALFSASDNPAVPLRAFMTGTLIAVLVGALYGFAILPRVDGFAMFIAVMAPVVLIGAALSASPRYGGIALAAMLGLGSPALISDHYINAFASYANGSIAQLVGIWYALVMVGLLQSAGAQAAIRRTVRAGWRDIATRSNLMRAPDVRGWINRMLDRVALLAPRVAATGQDSGHILDEALRNLRTGVAIGELRQLRLAMPMDQAAPLTGVLREVGLHYGRLDPADPAPASPTLLAHIDSAIRDVAFNPRGTIRRETTLALVSLRRNLFPAAPGYREAAA
ncbi:FUSC family protein [Sphingobium sufflavum]|uniref:FUSC family protein n=1 Tax=Sphingobium sufflavum TaxID=1129547 RepID=UPI001F1BB5DD|nr:FUSC family protein [Sphingobium sufflavum]MCE7796354.1 FUSC family protein [Sphingobium sufflavum]